MIKVYLIFLFAVIAACSKTPTSQSDEREMNLMWEKQLTKNEVLKIYGTDYQVVPNGIAYNRVDSKIPKYAFFFDKHDLVTEQFAMLDNDDLKKFKSVNKCRWEEKEHVHNHTDHTRYNVIGLCKTKKLKYEFKSNFGLFEITKVK